MSPSYFSQTSQILALDFGAQTLRTRFENLVTGLKAESRAKLDLAIANKASIHRLEEMRPYIPHILPAPMTEVAFASWVAEPKFTPPQRSQPIHLATELETYALTLLGRCDFTSGFPPGKEDFGFLAELVTNLACYPVAELIQLYRARILSTDPAELRRRRQRRSAATCFEQFINEEACDNTPMDPYLMYWYNASFPCESY
ncbi:hypothetical protein B0H11DRAFT_5319 [Mycena galericulata]|nr:hypothetical protein B0H11DRAFT_5319 [Mycena galericulata]